MTGCFDGGWLYAQHRVLRNGTLQRWEDVGCPPSGKRIGEKDVVATATDEGKVRRYDDTPPAEGMRGDVLDCCLYAGCGVGRIRSIEPAGELVKALGALARGT